MKHLPAKGEVTGARSQVGKRTFGSLLACPFGSLSAEEISGLPTLLSFRAKVPVVKAKIGPKVMTLIADGRVFDSLPVKTEAKVVISGIYITEIKSVRGGAIPTPPKKKGFFARFKRMPHLRSQPLGKRRQFTALRFISLAAK